MDDEVIERWKNITGIAQSVATVIAIIVGGVWAYKNFVKQRQDYPRLQVQQTVTHMRLSDRYNLLFVDEVLTNVSSVLVELDHGDTRVIPTQISPALNERRIGEIRASQLHYSEVEDPNTWPILAWHEMKWKKGDKRIEPGEFDQLHEVFLVPSNVTHVTVYSQYANPSATNLGWNVTSTHDLTRAQDSGGRFAVINRGGGTRGPDGSR